LLAVSLFTDSAIRADQRMVPGSNSGSDFGTLPPPIPSLIGVGFRVFIPNWRRVERSCRNWRGV
jgi:hypothetical protein